MNRELRSRLEDIALEVVHTAFEALPVDIRERSEKVPVSIESTPARHLLEDGFPGDLLGLFSGAAYPDELDSPDVLPAQIFLFLENLWDYAGGEEGAFREEVRITYLHELGHYLGLDEDALYRRGLE